MKKYILHIFLIISISSFGQSKFDDLNYKLINDASIEIGYPKSDFEFIFKDCSDLNICFEYEEPLFFIGKYKVSENDYISYYFSNGSSLDPQLIAVYKEKIILITLGNTFHIKGKTIYVEGVSNSYFDKKRKYVFENNNFKEIRQPYYSVGMKGTLNVPIKIYQTTEYKNEIAVLPKGYEVEIILVETEGEYDFIKNVLIKTKFGLIGWFDFDKISLLNVELIDGFIYHGD
jgi:hypothetical protein